MTEYKLHIHILKTLNLSVRCFLNEKLQEKASALTFSTILAIVPALAMLFAICKGFGFQHIIQSQLFDYFPAQRNALEYMLGFVDQYLDQMKGGVFACKILCLMGLRISERFTFLYIGPISVPRFRTMYLKTAGSGLAESEVMKLHIPDR